MKELVGYLLDRTTGAGIPGKTVAFTKLDGSPVTSADTFWQSTGGNVTDSNGMFTGRFELSPGPINTKVTVNPGVEVKIRNSNERAEFGFQWASDISRIARNASGVIGGFLSELLLAVPGGHTIRINTGAAIFNGSVFSIENGVMDITGVANTNPALTPRVDLITLRQYNESAAGQDSGRQQVVVTLGSTSNVAPPVQTGADFIDFPIGTVSTGYLATSKSLVADLRVFTRSTRSLTDAKYVPLYFEQDIANSGNKVGTGYFTAGTLSITGLDASLIYDGYIEVNLQINTTSVGAFYEVVWQTQHINASLRPTTLTDRRIARVAGQDNTQIGQLNYRMPLIGLTGVASVSYPLSLRCVYVSGNMTYLQSSLDSGNSLTNRMHAVLVARK